MIDPDCFCVCNRCTKCVLESRDNREYRWKMCSVSSEICDNSCYFTHYLRFNNSHQLVSVTNNEYECPKMLKWNFVKNICLTWVQLVCFPTMRPIHILQLFFLLSWWMNYFINNKIPCNCFRFPEIIMTWPCRCSVIISEGFNHA